MRYMLLICNDEEAIDALSPGEHAAAVAEYEAFGEEMGGRGTLLGGERLRRTTDATTSRGCGRSGSRDRRRRRRRRPGIPD
jgi:hypothetical protein